jgi:hypothetical protein
MEWSAVLSPVPQGLIALGAGPLGAWAAAVVLACLALLAVLLVASGGKATERETPPLRVIAGGKDLEPKAA